MATWMIPGNSDLDEEAYAVRLRYGLVGQGGMYKEKYKMCSTS